MRIARGGLGRQLFKGCIQVKQKATGVRGFCALPSSKPPLRVAERVVVQSDTQRPAGLSPAMVAALAAGSVIGLAVGGRYLYGQLVGQGDGGVPGGVGRDRSSVGTGVGRELTAGAERELLLAVPGSGRVVADPAAFSELVRAQAEQLEADRAQVQLAAAAAVKAEVAAAFEQMVPQVGRFANWYFSYGTSYRLLQKALSATARRAATPMAETTMAEAVSEEISEYIQAK